MSTHRDEQHQATGEDSRGTTLPTGKDGVRLGFRKDDSTFEPEEDPDQPAEQD
ncbi:hypothetical protein [Sinomonas sp.]|jgi:hypothetical protein|uniref:hypothetical protein n=1 Tax=Sinomonas sp. TaxID=1914986 RepID=UPI002FE32514